MKRGAYLEAVLDAFAATVPIEACVYCTGLDGRLLVEASSGNDAPGPGQSFPALTLLRDAWDRVVPPWEQDPGRSWDFAPLDFEGEPLGWMAVRGRPGSAWSEQERHALQALVHLAGQAIGAGRSHEDAARQLTRLSILMQIGHALSSNLELGPLLETVHTEVGRLFDTTNFFVALHRAQSPEWESAFRVEHGHREPPGRHQVGAGLTGFILRSGKPLFFSTAADKLAFLEREGLVAIGEPSKSWMGVPLLAGEVVVGAMVIQNYESEGTFSLDDLDLFQAIASQLAVAVRNAQLYEEADRRARETEAIAAIGRDITSSLDLETVLGRIASSVRSILTQDSLAIFLENEGQAASFNAVAVSGLMAAPLQATTLTLGKGILGSIIEQARPEIVNDTSSDPRAVHIEGTEEDATGEKLMAAPLFFRDRVIGVIAAWRRAHESPFEEADLAFLDGIGRQASVALHNAQLFGQSRSAQAEAETANRAKSSFLASMSHELRTPLNAILLYSELLMDEVREHGLSALGSDLDKIQGAGRHLLGLIDDILDLSKIEAGRMSVYLEDCDVPSLLAEITATAESLIAKNRNRFRLEADPSVHTLHTDQKKLRQMLFNLLSNAAKFTQDGLITVQVRRDPGDETRACFVVSDTGIGMSPEQMDRIFQEFTQAEASTSRNYGGTGLGLTLCRKFADLLDGEIRVESESGKGAVFTLVIPGLPSPSTASAPSITHPIGTLRGRILMIDDDQALRDALSRTLTKDGFEVASANNGLDGLEMAKVLSPQLITLDIAMPGFDGWQVLARLKADPELKRIPVVVITILDDRAKGFALEASDYLQKPVNREQLLEVVHRLVPRQESPLVLVVEDDEATREGLERILTEEGMTVRGCGEGTQALVFLRGEVPALILLDLMMPGMDGFQLMEELQRNEDWIRIPVVVLTAMALPPEARARLGLPQVQQIIQKGAYSRSELVEVIRKHALQNARDSVQGLS